MKTAVVTGAAGFIGSHLSEKLLDNKIKVIGIDSFTDYYSKKIKKNNLKKCLKNKNFHFIQNDLLKIKLEPIFKKTEYIFHHAAQPGVRSSWGMEFNTYVRNNILVTQKILESAKEIKTIKKIIIASSSSIYGDQEGVMKENKTVPKPKSPYGATKMTSENLGLIYASNYELPITAIRYFTVYGPRQRPDMAFTRFIINALNQNEVNVFGDGNQTRDFTYIDDIINANILCMNSSSTGESINVGGGQIISINKILTKIQNNIQNEFKIKYLTKQKGDVDHTQADISKAKKILKFSPKIKIDDGLKNQIEYLKNHLKLYNNVNLNNKKNHSQ